MSVDKSRLSMFSSSESGGSAGEATPGASTFNPVGIWYNELGSTMTIETFDGANFSGVYASAVGQNGSANGVLAGTINGNAIGFTVNWQSAATSVTSWNGVILADGNTPIFYTLWHLASSPASIGEAWESILAGADIFFPAGS